MCKSGAAPDAAIALVVGGTTGFGAAITRELQLAGLSVITVGRSRIAPPAARAHFPCDVGNNAAWSTTVDQIVVALGYRRIGVLVYTVGYARVYPFSSTPLEEWTQHFQLNVLYVAQSFPRFAPLLQNHARVATTGSQWSFRHGWPDLAPYITAKHALSSLTTEYSRAFPQHIFRHYCVPSMVTPGTALMRQSVIQNGAHLHPQSDPTRPADPVRIGSAFAGHLLSQTDVEPVVCEIDSEGYITVVGERHDDR